MHAEAILQRMWQLYDAGNVDVKPDTVTYNSVLGVWAASHEPGDFFGYDEGIVQCRGPQCKSRCGFIWNYHNALSKIGGNLSVGEHIDKHLHEMKHFDIHPNKKVYTNAIKASTKSKDGKAKERISALKNAIGCLRVLCSRPQRRQSFKSKVQSKC